MSKCYDELVKENQSLKNFIHKVETSQMSLVIADLIASKENIQLLVLKYKELLDKNSNQELELKDYRSHVLMLKNKIQLLEEECVVLHNQVYNYEKWRQ